MKSICPDCHKEIEWKNYETVEEETEIWSDETIVPVYLRCPNCGHHFIGTIHYTFSRLDGLEHNEDYDDEDYNEDEE